MHQDCQRVGRGLLGVFRPTYFVVLRGGTMTFLRCTQNDIFLFSRDRAGFFLRACF